MLLSSRSLALVYRITSPLAEKKTNEFCVLFPSVVAGCFALLVYLLNVEFKTHFFSPSHFFLFSVQFVCLFVCVPNAINSLKESRDVSGCLSVCLCLCFN